MGKIVIFGISDAAELAHYYFTHDTTHEVKAFSVDEEYLPESRSFCGLPIVPFNKIKKIYPPKEYKFFVALGYSKLNMNRKEKYLAVKALGYELVSYVSTKATVLNEGRIGDNCFILEDNTIQPFVSIGNNVTIWSGTHIGHHSTIEDHCFLASHIVISGHVHVDKFCFIGVNATLRDNITIGEKSIVGAGTLLLRSVEKESLYIGTPTERASISSLELRKI